MKIIFSFLFVPFLLTLPAEGNIILTEDFEGTASTGWGNTIFSSFLMSGGGVFETTTSQGINGAPAGPHIPAGSDADLEGRYYEGSSIAASGSYALLSENFTANDMSMDGYIGLGILDNGGPSGSFLLRMNGKNGYMAVFNKWNPNEGIVVIFQLRNGVASANYPQIWSPSFAMNWENENIHLYFEAVGNKLRAKAWRVTSTGEFPVCDITLTDDMYNSGTAGICAFARGECSVFFDDITITIPEPSTILLLGLGGLAVQFRQRYPMPILSKKIS